MKRMILALAATALIVNMSASKTHEPVTPVASVQNRPMVHKAVKRPCHTPTPTSAAGYAEMFASVPTSQWGAADVSISVPLPNGKVVWLYGDTFSEGRFVHSTMIVQNRGCLHVSNGGSQLLPNLDSQHIFWIESAKAESSNQIRVLARAITITDPKNPWGFKDGGYTQAFIVQINDNGDAGMVKKDVALNVPAPNVGGFIQIDDNPHHFGYAQHTHPWAKLASGKTLVTTCQNWDDGVLHPFKDYRPIFSEK